MFGPCCFRFPNGKGKRSPKKVPKEKGLTIGRQRATECGAEVKKGLRNLAARKKTLEQLGAPVPKDLQEDKAWHERFLKENGELVNRTLGPYGYYMYVTEDMLEKVIRYRLSLAEEFSKSRPVLEL